MEGLSRAAGSGSEIELGDKKYRMTPLQFDDIGWIENRILKDRPNPIVKVAEAKEQLPDDIFRELLKVAYEDAKKANRVSEEEFNEYVESREGQVVVLWLSIRHNHPEIELEFVQQKIEEKSSDKFFEEFKREIEIGTGMDELGNLTGGQAPVTGLTAEGTGGTSIASLPASTDSDQTPSTN